MTPSESTNVFVSYSHADASLVAPVVKLLRVNKSLAFQDIDDIQPGRRWRSEIDKALVESHLVVVFWCDHANRSNEVSKEWKAAIELQKDLLPLLLDATPLPPELGEFQWIDFRGAVGANHSSIDSPDNAAKTGAPSPRSTAPVRLTRWLFPAGLAAALGVAAVVLSLLTFKAQAPLRNPTSAPSGPTRLPLPARPETFSFVFNTLLLLGVVFAACLVWLWRRRSKRRISIERARRHPGEIEQHIASELGFCARYKPSSHYSGLVRINS